MLTFVQFALKEGKEKTDEFRDYYIFTAWDSGEQGSLLCHP